MLKLPLASVFVPVFLPLISTVAASTGIASFSLTTLPFIIWAEVKNGIK